MILTLFAFAAAAAAQVPSTPSAYRSGKIDGLDGLLNLLTSAYYDGRWADLQSEMADLHLNEIKGCEDIDPAKNFYIVVFLSRDADGDCRLLRFLWHDPAGEPYAARIPGRKEIYEIVLGADSDIDLKTVYFSTEREDPLLAQIPKFARTIEPALIALARKRTGPEKNFEVRKVSLPFTRAKIKIVDSALLSAGGIEKTVKETAGKLADLFAKAGRDKDGLAARLAKIVKDAPGRDTAQEMAEAFRQALREDYRAYVVERKLGLPEQAEPALVEKAFLDVVDKAASKEIEATTEYVNVPLERFDFGLISAFLLGKVYAADRVKVTDDGYFAPDPPSNPLAAAVVDFHPLPYDPEAGAMTEAERFRLFAGVVLKPDAGFCLGAGYGLIRGLSWTAGVAFMGIPTANRPYPVEVGGRIKTMPGYPLEPFRTKWKAAAFAGLGYSF